MKSQCIGSVRYPSGRLNGVDICLRELSRLDRGMEEPSLGHGLRCLWQGSLPLGGPG
jgi:hypothetical protein